LRCRRSLGGVGAECTAPGHDDIDVERDQLGRESGEPFGFPLSISIFDHEVADHGGCSPANPALLCLIYSAVSPHVLRLLCRYCAFRAGSLTLTPASGTLVHRDRVDQMGTSDNGEASGSQTFVGGCLTGRRSTAGSPVREARPPFAAQPGSVLAGNTGIVTRSVGRDRRSHDFIGSGWAANGRRHQQGALG